MFLYQILPNGTLKVYQKKCFFFKVKLTPKILLKSFYKIIRGICAMVRKVVVFVFKVRFLSWFSVFINYLLFIHDFLLNNKISFDDFMKGMSFFTQINA